MSERYATYPSLFGKGIVVTGGAIGIGQAIAVAFAQQGARVAIIDRASEAGEKLSQMLGSPHKFFNCDVTDNIALRKVIDEAAQVFGHLNVLVTNAADDSRHDISAVNQQLWETCLSVNLGHQFFAAQFIERHLRDAGGGSIICLGSIAWLNNTTEMVAYTIAKSGVHGLVRTLARLWGKKGIRVNGLLPGWTMTERQRALYVNAEAESQIDASQCLPGRVMPEDIARMALFLASDDAAMVTQQAFIVDGGWV